MLEAHIPLCYRPGAYLPLKECPMYNTVVLYCCSCPRAYLPLCPLPIRAWWRCAMPKIHHLAFPFPTGAGTGSTHVVRYQEHHRWRCTWFMQRGDLPLSQKLGKKQLGAHLQHGRQSIEEMGGLGWGGGGRQLYAGHPSGQSFLMAKKEPP